MQSFAAQAATFGLMSVFIFGTPLLTHQVAKKYVTALWWKEGTSKFEMQNITFLNSLYLTQFDADDVFRPTMPGAFTSIKVKDKPVFFDPAHFTSAEAYEKLMGFDKPIDASNFIDGEEAQNSSVKKVS